MGVTPITTLPEFHKIANHAEGVDFYKVDVDSAQDIAQELGIRAMPTFVLFEDGKKIADVIGANPQALVEMIGQAQRLNQAPLAQPEHDPVQ
ncbi:hypothetical protein FRC06_008430 [Ceratobasidium sp. 370]|nr:hypothetical protein FRC06_008430 [Ceratobasidium sp. 370]